MKMVCVICILVTNATNVPDGLRRILSVIGPRLDRRAMAPAWVSDEHSQRRGEREEGKEEQEGGRRGIECFGNRKRKGKSKKRERLNP